MTQPYVVFGVPSFRGTPEREFFVSFCQTQTALAEAKIRFDVILLAGDPYLPKARSRITSQFLTDFPQADTLFFLDDDVGWSPASKVIEMLYRKEDIVFGAYPKKQEGLTFPVTLELDATGQLIERDGLYQAHLCPTGFMRVKRRVLEQMAMKASRYYETAADGRELLQWNIFEARFVDPVLEALRKTDIDGLSPEMMAMYLKRAIGLTPCPDIGKWWGEDFWFVERWREMGGTCWVDPEITFTHRGSKAWAATFGDSVRATLAKMREAA